MSNLRMAGALVGGSQRAVGKLVELVSMKEIVYAAYAARLSFRPSQSTVKEWPVNIPNVSVGCTGIVKSAYLEDGLMEVAFETGHVIFCNEEMVRDKK